MKTLARLVTALILPLLSITSSATNGYIYYGDPAETLKLWRGNYVAIGGKYKINPAEYWTYYLPNISSSARLSMKYFWNAYDLNDIAVDSPDISITGSWSTDRNYTFPLGTMTPSGLKFTYKNGAFSSTWYDINYNWRKVYNPRVFNLRLAINQSTLQQLQNMGGFTGLFTLYQRWQNIILDTSTIATDLFDNNGSGFGCATWYEIGVVTNTLTVQSVASEADFSNLLPGINLVKSITKCGGEDGIFDGCADLQGNRIAISINSPEWLWKIIALHEIGHTQGLQHNTSSSTNVMWWKGSDQTTILTNAQCISLQKARNYL